MDGGQKFKGMMRNEDYKLYLDRCKESPAIAIELSSLCNFKCYYCNYPTSERNKEFMSDELFYHIAPQLQEFGKRDVGVNWGGESTLHPKFVEYSKHLNSLGMKIVLSTNGSTLDSKYFEIDCSWMRVYLDVDANNFKRRSGSDYRKHISRIVKFTSEWLRNDSSMNIRYFLQLTKLNYGEDVSADLIKMQNFVHWFLGELGLLEDVQCDFSKVNIATYAKANGATLLIGQTAIMSGGLFPVTADNPAPNHNHENMNFGFCDSPWKICRIAADGRLAYCCDDIEGGTIFTDKNEIWERSVKDLWINHRVIVELREKMSLGELTSDACRKCLSLFPTREKYNPFEIAYDKKVASYQVGERIMFDVGGFGDKYVKRGFAPPTNLTWTMSPRATLSMSIDSMPANSNWVLAFKAVARLAADGSDREFFELFINGKKIAEHPIIHQQLHEYVFPLNGAIVGEGDLVNIEFVVSDQEASFLPMNPANMPRIGLQSLRISLAD